MATKKKNAIPDRWTDYTPLGKRMPGTRFIALKVPLKQSFRYQLTQSEAFGPFDLVRMLEKEGQELGLIIDLTFTTRYYKVEDLPNTLYHLKIFTAGHEVPNNATILSFKKAVRHFLRDNENNDKLIGVHCTHGLNRTGYLICRYLIDVEGMNPQNAINLFNESRGHSIERQNYLDDLTKGPRRSNEGMEEPDQEPAQGLANEPRDDAPHHHRREQHNHDPPFNGEGPHQWRREPQNQYLPFQKKNNRTWFRPPEPQFSRPPLIPHPPQGMRPMRPCFPNKSAGGFHFGHYPPPLPSYSNEGMEEPDQEPAQGLANEPRDDAPHDHRREQHNHDPPFNGEGPHQGRREPQNQFLPFQEKNNRTWFRPPEPQFSRPTLDSSSTTGHETMRPCFPNKSAGGFHFGHYPPPLPSYSNEGMEEPDQEPAQGLANEPRDDAPHDHRREQHNHDPPFNGEGPHQGRREPQNQFLPFQQKNNRTLFRPPEPQFSRTTLDSSSTTGHETMRPCFPNKSAGGFHFGHFPPLPSHRFGQPYHNPHASPERFTRPPGPHRTHRYRHRTGPNDRTPR